LEVTTMKHVGGFVAVVVCLAVLAPSAGAQNPKTAITGTTPFSLGMATADALAADPTLTRIATTACAAPAPATSYGTRVTAPLGGYPYTADLILCFAGDKLGAIHLIWSQSAFQADTIRWQLATHALAGQISASYAPGLVRRYTVDDDMGAALELADDQGNLLRMTSDPGHEPDINIMYMSAAYDQAVNGKRIAITSY
jgi:hypothetical protein